MRELRRPIAFVVVVAGIFAARVLTLQAHGLCLLGGVPQGLPSLGPPAVGRHDLNALLPIALACSVLGAVETFASGRMFAQKHGHQFDAKCCSARRSRSFFCCGKVRVRA